jgi:hypothetical protein
MALTHDAQQNEWKDLNGLTFRIAVDQTTAAVG